MGQLEIYSGDIQAISSYCLLSYFINNLLSCVHNPNKNNYINNDWKTKHIKGDKSKTFSQIQVPWLKVLSPKKVVRDRRLHCKQQMVAAKHTSTVTQSTSITFDCTKKEHKNSSIFHFETKRLIFLTGCISSSLLQNNEG